MNDGTTENEKLKVRYRSQCSEKNNEGEGWWRVGLIMERVMSYDPDTIQTLKNYMSLEYRF